jgi:hypothetical protein
MRYFSALINVVLIIHCYRANSQDAGCEIINNIQNNIIFNFTQNDSNFKDKIVIYPYLGSRTFRDFENDVTDLVKLGFNRDDLLSDDTTRYIFEKGCQSQLIICFDTIVKYKRISDSILESFESNRRNIEFKEDSSQIKEENIEKYSLSGFISGIYQKKMCEFNRPIISTNGKFAVLEYFFQCGWLCGKGAVLLLENKNNKWTIKKYLLITQS